MGPEIKFVGIAALAVAIGVGAAMVWRRARRPAGVPAELAGALPDAESMADLRANAHSLVWAGFLGRAEIIEVLPEVAVVDVDEAVLAPLVDAEFAAKRTAEMSWPERTDCDRLDEAFDKLNQRGIFARQYQGYTQSDGHEDMSEALVEAEAEGGEFTGYCFYTAQDAENAVNGQTSLYLAFGTNLEQPGEVQQALGAPDNVGAAEAGQAIVDTLRELGFDVAWDGTPASRIEIRHLDWKRRLR
jgi:hypothetical protein